MPTTATSTTPRPGGNRKLKANSQPERGEMGCWQHIHIHAKAAAATVKYLLLIKLVEL